MVTLPSIKEIVEKYNLTAKKSLGQNFIFDQNLTDKIVRSAGNVEDKIIIEIGPGPGGLTRSILNQNIKKLIVIEQDARFIELLHDLKNIYNEKLEIIHGDALNIQAELIAPNAKIIANLPYNIATPLLFNWLENIKSFESLTLMFQKEVADRIMAKPRTKAYGRLSVMVQAFATVTHGFDIPPTAFFPPPKITSSVINIIPNDNSITDMSRLSKLCKIAFGQRRKLLKSNISKILKDDPIRIFDELNILINARAEELSIEQFCKLSEFII